MSARYWIYAVALGLAASAYAQEDVGEPVAKPQSGKEQPSEQATVDAQPHGATSVSPTNPASSKHDRDTPQNGDAKKADLPEIILGDGWAQWAMAITGFGALCLSGWAVWLLSATLKATKRAVDETEKGSKAAILAAEAASEANTIMREESRPWLDFEIDSLDLRHGYGSDGLVFPYFSTEISIMNWGKSPAIYIIYDMKVFFGERFNAEEIDTFVKECTDGSRLSFPKVLFPSAEPKKAAFSCGLNSEARMELNGSGIKDRSAMIVALLLYAFDGEWRYTAKTFTCNEEDLLPRPRTNKFTPTRLDAFDRYT